MRNNLFLGVAVVALVAPAAAMAQDTTATIRGSVQSAGVPVNGATVVITNVPSGTRSTATTDASGTFIVTGLRAGGPFTVDIASAQGSTSVTDIFTVIGQPFDLPIELAAGGTASSDEIVVTASSIRGAGTSSDGPQTVLSARDISKVASVNRDIRDIQRRDPFATLDLSNNRAVSFAGSNPRFNRFSINGVSVSDNFGLNPDASPTARGPIPFDAIAQVSVSIAPYDFRQGNFQGGAIDATLASGTNDFHGTGFYSQNTDGLYGKKIGSFTRPDTNFKSETYGATLSGPIIKDKLFFMVSAERNTEARPLTIASPSQVPFGTGNFLTTAQVDNVAAIAQSVYGYDAGEILSIAQQKDEKIVGKLDWNITDGQKLALSYVNAFDSFVVSGSNSQSAASPGFSLDSNGYKLGELLRAGIAQLNSDWSDTFSTEVRGTYKKYTRTRDPLRGNDFAQFRVCLDPTSVGTGGQAQSCSTGTPVIAFGPDASSQSNTFATETFGGSALANVTVGDHSIRLLGEFSRVTIKNLFLQNSAGSYYFDSLADFQARRANQVTYQDAVSLNTDDAAADFGYQQYTFGAQDSWRVSDTLNLTYGARYDLYDMQSRIPYNANFQNRVGFANTKNFKGLGAFQPRISFDFKPPVARLKLRGGAGIFAGGAPDVYLSNSFSNTGVVTNSVTVNRITSGASAYNQPVAVGDAALNNVNGAAIPAALANYLSTNTGSLSTAPVNAIDPSFDIPSTLKATFSADYDLFGIEFGADYIYSKVIQQVQFSDARSVVIGRLPDGRPRYAARTNAGGISVTDPNTDIVLGNTNRGRGHVWDVRASKTFDWGLSLGGSYTWQDVKDATPATSSTALSNYGNAAMVDPNFAAYGRSNDETRWAFKYNIGFDHAFFGDYRTAIQLFGETRAGRNYSFTMIDQSGGTSNRSPVFGTLSNNGRYLLYVPTGANDPLVSYDTPGTQTALDNLINKTELKDYRGKIAGRNIARSRAFTRIDLHLEQQVPTFIGGSRVTIFGDIENLPNLLNSKWGGLRQLAFPSTASVVQVQCLAVATATGAPGVVNTAANQTCTQYRYSSFIEPATARAPVFNGSLYLIRIGARFTF
ncbi:MULTISPECIES: carboxypeptidase regulatory-like domain-containing protein [unclassified Sphingomonas]|uniref:TonB-dependent receptor n=1 Tax=Sphingomonas TaxID=13687 RepID=UPI001047EF78|nr:carboxypeptidase regulatory-like domain-containing protein [Sphingomonas sp. PP-CC-3A-396]TCQ09309.1 carboxypeptidase family protein [Sphingomonas sp. PP-CC-3A-396]